MAAPTEDEEITLASDFPAKLIKWKIKQHSQITRGATLALFEEEKTKKQINIRCQTVGTVKQLLARVGELYSPGAVIAYLEPCKHPIVMKEMCAECGADLRGMESSGQNKKDKGLGKATVAMVHTVPDLIVSQEQAVELGRADEERLLKNRKLVLLVDLDQTIVHTTNDAIPPNLKDVYHFQLWHGPHQLWYHAKFRPGTERFLSQISKLYEMHICTFGARYYAHTIARFLDPDGKYFSHRILSRDECFNPVSKTANLKSLFPCGDGLVCIIDDREDVWNFAPNMVHVKAYRYFEGTADINAPPGIKDDTEEHEATPKHQERMVKVKRTVSRDGRVEETVTEVNEKTDINIKTAKSDKDSGTHLPDGSGDKSESPDQAHPQGKHSDKAIQESDKSKPMTTIDKNKNSTDVVKVGTKSKASDVVTSSQVESDDGTKTSEVSQGSGDDQPAAKEIKVGEEQSKEKVDQKQEEDKKENNTCDKQDSPMDTSGSSKSTGNAVDFASADTEDSDIVEEKEEEMIEWVDDDDYLFYLEEVLTRIHKAFYQVYDQATRSSQRSSPSQGDAAAKTKLPDLKNIIPYVKRKVLRGVNILFSGVFPTNSLPEKSRAYIVAKNLGANIHSQFVPRKDKNDTSGTTHVVAARPGTTKVKQAAKQRGVKIVNPDWLWCCADRWERVEESLFPLSENSSYPASQDSPEPGTAREKKRGDKRKREDQEQTEGGDQEKRSRRAEAGDTQPATSTQEASRPLGDVDGETSRSEKNKAFSDTVSAMMCFSSDEICSMGKEMDDMLSEESEEEEGEIISADDAGTEESEADNILRKKVLANKDDDSSSEDSLSGEFPRGWKKKRSPSEEEHEDMAAVVQDDQEESQELVENPHRIFRFSDQSSSSSSNSEDASSVGSVDEEMAAAVEKEFLS